jgi:hypothetical protein
MAEWFEDLRACPESFRGANVHWEWNDRVALRGALTRKAIAAKLSGSGDIVIWGDGTQTRSFMYIDDCVDGTQRIMHSGITDPINLGSDELVTINELVDVIEAAGVDLERAYDRTKPQGVDGRNSDNTKILDELGATDGAAGRDGGDGRVDRAADAAASPGGDDLSVCRGALTFGSGSAPLDFGYSWNLRA